MLTEHSYQLLNTAAIPAVERIRKDRGDAPQRLKPLLAYIEKHLFDPTLDVNQLKRSCGVRDNSVPIQFHSAVGRPPHGYIEDRRLETACRLLAETDLKIWQISELLGYSSIQVFSRAFSRWSGQRPTLYRKKARRRAGGPPTPPEERLFDADSLRKALAGELPADDATALIERLLRLYPSCRRIFQQRAAGSVGPSSHNDDDSFFGATSYADSDASNEPPVAVHLSSGEIDRLRAEEILRQLEKLPADRQDSLIGELRLTTPTLFHMLRRKSLDIAQEKPRRGIRLAELALRSVDVLEKSVDDERLLANLRARGWAALADARRATLDDRSAEQGFAQAERFFHAGGRVPESEADIAFHKALLRHDQRRFDEATGLLERALTLYRHLGRDDRVKAALTSLAKVLYDKGDPAAAVSYLQEALQRTPAADGGARTALTHKLLTACVDSGRYAEAYELLPDARQLTLAFGRGADKIRLRWLEGVVLRELRRFASAESALLEARDAFSKLDDSVAAALVCLDLGELYWQQGRSTDLERLSASMVPLFGNFQHHREALASLKLFHQAAEERRMTHVLLHKARVALRGTDRLRAHPQHGR